MNNIFLNNNDPLLFNSGPKTQFDQMNDYYNEMYKLQLLQQLQLQMNYQMKDWIGSLDLEIKELEPSVAQSLSLNNEYTELNNTLQNTILLEMIELVKAKLNTNQKVIENVLRQQEIIKKTKSMVKAEETQSFSELNDYMKNYSHLTFDEYKKIKAE